MVEGTVATAEFQKTLSRAEETFSNSSAELAIASEIILERGDNFHVYTGLRHQMIALEDTELFEFSTQHFDSDSHRIEKGD